MTTAERNPARCEHDRTAATCEACAHAAARADGRRAAATREELYPYPDGGALRTGFITDGASAADFVSDPPKKATPRRLRS